MAYLIRPEQPSDYPATLILAYEAFQTLDFPGRKRLDEHYLLHLLKGTDYIAKSLCFVAEANGEIAGHILYTNSWVGECPTATFGPLSVLPKFQRQGIGRVLVAESMGKAREMGYKAVVITGIPDYYPKLGFSRGRDFGVALSDGSSPDGLMAYELTPGALKDGGILGFEAMELFDKAENDDCGFNAFHKAFMSEYFPSELTIRRLFDGDVPLASRWLNEPHVSKWFKHPGHWMRELADRRGAFSFISHFIAEYEGEPVGFCQYYDKYFSQEHEVWNDKWDIPSRAGEVFSIDMLIGSPINLRRGFGKSMILLLLEKIREIGGKTVICQPEKANIASCKALESAGFKLNGEAYSFELA